MDEHETYVPQAPDGYQYFQNLFADFNQKRKVQVFLPTAGQPIQPPVLRDRMESF